MKYIIIIIIIYVVVLVLVVIILIIVVILVVVITETEISEQRRASKYIISDPRKRTKLHPITYSPFYSFHSFFFFFTRHNFLKRERC